MARRPRVVAGQAMGQVRPRLSPADPSSPPARPHRAESAVGRLPRAVALLLNQEKGLAQQLEEREGPICTLVTHVNSAYEDLFAGIYFHRSSGASVQMCFPLLLLFG